MSTIRQEKALNKMVEMYKKIKKYKEIIIIVLVILGFILFLPPKNNWTLISCKEKLNESECYTTGYTISGFKSLNQCITEGFDKFKEEGFECGNNCKENSGGLMVCEEICNSGGCTN